MIKPPTYFDGSIKRMIMVSFMFVLLVPIGFSITSLFENSWSNAQQRMLEKHLLISEALVEPFTLFVSARQKAINTVGAKISSIHTERFNPNMNKKHHNQEYKETIQKFIDNYQNSNDDIDAVFFISADKEIKNIATNKVNNADLRFPDYSQLHRTFIKKNDGTAYKADSITPVFTSSFSNKPVVLLSGIIEDKNKKEIGTISAEMSLKYIESMCSKINFGEKGHCAIVDQRGHVVAHPNKEWVKETRDLSKISVVKEMMAGNSGTTEFYSPFLKADMVAGYSAIPALGWGVMIPQPKSELTQTFDTIKVHTFLWLGLGILVALIIAYFLMRKIISPINNLIERTKEINSGDDYIGLGVIPKNSPSEIRHLWTSFAILLVGLQESNKKVKRLNISLNKEVDRATKKLRDVNDHLYQISNQDYVTSIANRRYFNNQLQKVLQGQRKESIGILAIDLDNFKRINDNYGHDVGDFALKHLSEILKGSTRKDDLVARLGGDEFVVYVKDLSNKELTDLAEEIRYMVAKNHLRVNDEEIKLTISVGVVNYIKDEKYKLTLKQLLANADHAMYCSKEAGRNQVSFYHIGKEQSDKEEMLKAFVSS